MSTGFLLRSLLLVVVAAHLFIRAVPATAEGEPLAVALHAVNGSGIEGTATITGDGNGASTVVIAVSGATGGHPAFIHRGTCSAVDPAPAFPLADVDGSGSSTTMVNATLASLAAGGYAIVIHQSIADLATYIVCGDIAAGEPAPAAAAAATKRLTVKPVGDSAVRGKVTLTESGDFTIVLIAVSGAAGGEPVAIYDGYCDDPGSLAFPLANLDANGSGETSIEIALVALRAAPYSIVIAATGAGTGSTVACAQTRARPDPTPAPAPVETPALASAIGADSTAPATLPVTGHNGAPDRADRVDLAWLLGVAVLALIAGTAARRRTRRV